MTLALARKYRPKSFASVAVQTHVATTLKGAIARGRVAHGYLLCGPRGTGKTTLARVLAMALNCENKRDDGEPCGECTSCMRIWAGSETLDVVEIDAASNRGVEEARDLRERAMYAPTGDDRYKVYIVDEAHMLTGPAWNSLLKILEEPPPRVVFVFATTDPQKIAQAAAPVLSRLQRFDLKRIGIGEIRTRLTSILEAENVAVEPDALNMIARAADGSMRDALSLADQVVAFGEGRITADGVRLSLGLIAEDELLALFDTVAERRAADVFTASARLAESGADYSLLLTGFGDLLRGQLAIELGGMAPDISDSMRTALTERKGRFTAPDLVRMMSVLVEHEPIFRKSSQPQMLFEALLVRFALLDRTVGLEDVIRAVGGGGGEKARGQEDERTRGREETRPADRLRDSAPPRRAAPAPMPTPAFERPVAREAAPVAKPPTLADAAPPRPRLADAPPASPTADQSLDINRMAERWDDVVAEFRGMGKGLVAQLLEESTPAAVSAAGVVTIDAESDLTMKGLAEAEKSILAAVQRHFAGVTKLAPRLAGSAPRRRYDATTVKAERAASLKSGDPLLAAAIDALDLELIE